MSPITQTPIPLSDEWATPADLFADLDFEFGFTLDAAAAPWNAKCPRYFTRDDDGLSQRWAHEVVWLNPPYSDIARWLNKATQEWQLRRATVVCLVPCTPDRHWWTDYVEGRGEVRLLTRSTLRTGRVHFIREDGTSGRAPFPSALVIYRRGAASRAEGDGR